MPSWGIVQMQKLRQGAESVWAATSIISISIHTELQPQ